jgi:hypothetical protein
MTGSASSSSSSATDSGSYARFVLAQLRVAAVKADLMATEIDSIGTALAGGFVDVDTAITWANEIGAIGLIGTSSATLFRCGVFRT